MLSRKHRFHGYHSLDQTYRHGKTVRSPAMTLRYYQNPKRTDYRAAVVVSKKVNKSAVGRNRIRRRIYESIRRQAALVSGSYDLIFTVRSADVLDTPAKDLDLSIRRLLSQLK